MKWELVTLKSGKKYIRVDHSSLICILWNRSSPDIEQIEDDMTEMIVKAVNEYKERHPDQNN